MIPHTKVAKYFLCFFPEIEVFKSDLVLSDILNVVLKIIQQVKLYKLTRDHADEIYIVCRDKKVYDTEERKKFCSGTCFKASNFLRNQLDISPLWIRKHFILDPRPIIFLNFQYSINNVYPSNIFIRVFLEVQLLTYKLINFLDKKYL